MSMMMPSQLQGPPGQPVPGGLAQQMYGGQDEDQQPQAQDGGLSALQDVIEDFPALLAALHDPGDVNTVAQCLAKLTSVQNRLMTAQSGPQSGPQGY